MAEMYFEGSKTQWDSYSINWFAPHSDVKDWSFLNLLSYLYFGDVPGRCTKCFETSYLFT